MSRDSLELWAQTPGAKRLLREARRRLERGSELLRGSLRVDFSPAERHDIGALLGLTWEVSGRDVPLKALHHALNARGSTLRALLERDAPLRNHRQERNDRRAAVVAETDAAIAALAVHGVDRELATWVLARRRTSRSGNGELLALAQSAAQVWAYLAHRDDQPLLLAQLAGELFHDTHALDRSTQLGRVVANLALGTVHAIADIAALDVTKSAQWRQAWALVGVTCDEVSSLVLVLNLSIDGNPMLSTLTSIRGEPTWLSLRSFRQPWKPTIADAWICENPAILEAAAEQLGPRCPPLICTFGRPSTAGIELIRGLHDAGVRLHLRADDDAAGQSIVRQLLEIAPDAELWHYQQRAPQTPAPDVYEEQLLSALLRDLTQQPPGETTPPRGPASVADR